MNTWQALKQIQTDLKAAVWPGTSSKLFAGGAVLVSAGTIPEVAASIPMPAILLRPLGATPDPDHSQEPDLIQQDIAATLIALVAGDPYGEHVLMGAGRQSDGQGRGLLEIEEQVLETIGLVNALEGLTIQLTTKSLPRAERDPKLGHLAWRDYEFQLDCGISRHYERGGPLLASETGGTITLTWTLPTGRWDISKAILRRASGSTAPTSPTGGTGITLSGDLALTVDDSPGSGTWSYALFVEYDDGSTSYSDSRTTTVVVS